MLRDLIRFADTGEGRKGGEEYSAALARVKTVRQRGREKEGQKEKVGKRERQRARESPPR